MEFSGIDEFMLFLKRKYDLSEKKQDWRALTGRDHVGSTFDTFIFSDEKVYQIKAVELAPQRMAAVAREVGGPSPDLIELIKGGAPVPLNVTAHRPSAYTVIMFGMQQYSSDVSEQLKREYYSSKQDIIDRDLKHSLKVLLERPEYRHAYRELKERQESYYA